MVFVGAENLSIAEDDGGTASILQEFDMVTALVVLPELGPGTIEISYNVTVPSNIPPGSSHEFDGAVQVNGNEVPIAEDTELGVAADTSKPSPFDVKIDEDRSSEPIAVGESLMVTAMVESTGDETGTQSVPFTVDDTE